MASKQAVTTLSDSAPAGMTTLLPVAQFEKSHNLEFDPRAIKDGMLVIVAPAYQAMSAGDNVPLTIEFEKKGFPIVIEPVIREKTLTESDIGLPLQWTVEPSKFFQFPTFHATFSYRIDYATDDDTAKPTTHSEKQEFHLVAPTSDLLPRLAVKDYDGDMLDPEAFPKGIVLDIPLYDGIQVGDDVVLYALGKTLEVKTVRVDQSTLDSERLHIKLGHEWLMQNVGLTISLSYQYARVGNAGTSVERSLTLSESLYLPHPIVEDAEKEGEDEEYKRYLLSEYTTQGIYIQYPPDAVVSGKVQMIFDGFSESGRFVADPSIGNPRRFYIPPRYVPANLGKRLFVKYEVTPPGAATVPSLSIDLRINDFPASQWRPIQVSFPPGNNNAKVSLATVTDSLRLTLTRWSYIAQGQRVRVIANGLLATGGEKPFEMRIGDAEQVTEAEFKAGQLTVLLPGTYLATLMLNVKFDVTVEISFDGGFSYKKHSYIEPLLVL
ncbi:hypothetical protein [Pseudomonas sp. NPDC086251]|uniref:hypothetical protein n=1 Tax=Pseudomonas sp. NPDC086251 TaxID=3364431 RepID=UPI0038391150